MAIRNSLPAFIFASASNATFARASSVRAHSVRRKPADHLAPLLDELLLDELLELDELPLDEGLEWPPACGASVDLSPGPPF